MPQIYCNNHAHAAHAVCSSGDECHGHGNAPSITAPWPCTEADVAAMSVGSDTHKPAETATYSKARGQPAPRPIWQLQQGPAKQRGSHLLRGLASRDTGFTCHCCDGQNLPGATIRFLLSRLQWSFLYLTNHIVIRRLEKIRLESEQEPPFGGTKRAQCSLCCRTRFRIIS